MPGTADASYSCAVDVNLSLDEQRVTLAFRLFAEAGSSLGRLGCRATAVPLGSRVFQNLPPGQKASRAHLSCPAVGRSAAGLPAPRHFHR